MPTELLKQLDDTFFAVCRTAIQNTKWKYSDFEKIKAVEGILMMLEDARLSTETPVAEEGVEIKGVKTPPEVTPAPASPEQPAVAPTAPPAVPPVAPAPPSQEALKKK